VIERWISPVVALRVHAIGNGLRVAFAEPWHS
jgi:hypothetical protein